MERQSLEPQQRHDLERADAIGRKAGVGCFMTILGFFSGGMVAVLVGKMVAFLMRAPKCSGVPLCEWPTWVGIGGLIGAITLPILVLSRLGRPAAPPTNSDRG